MGGVRGGVEKNRGGGTKVSREYKGSGQGRWAVRKVGNIETRKDRNRQDTIQYYTTQVTDDKTEDNGRDRNSLLYLQQMLRESKKRIKTEKTTECKQLRGNLCN